MKALHAVRTEVSAEAGADRTCVPPPYAPRLSVRGAREGPAPMAQVWSRDALPCTAPGPGDCVAPPCGGGGGRGGASPSPCAADGVVYGAPVVMRMESSTLQKMWE